jgi:2-oxoglutarate dehydrogenase E2 component (dihydrolipoamide succinyltransferase)
MSIQVRVPELGESISDALLVRWLKDDGATVRADEPIVELETDKSAMELVAEGAGRLSLRAQPGERVRVGQVIGEIDEARVDAAPSPVAERAREAERPPAAPAAATRTVETPRAPSAPEPPREARRTTERPAGNGDGGRQPARVAAAAAPGAPSTPRAERRAPPTDEDVERVPMSELRRTIARRLVEAQREAAILTTFNEVDVGEVQTLRQRYRQQFKQRHGVDLGLMSLFARATVLALREVRIVNASIEGDDVVYHRRVHLGIAVSTERGLVVPVVRDADRLDVAGLERAIGALAARARETKLVPDDLRGGTFTITNGGVFGSLLSTPILNPPQSGILGMHTIQPRPVARDGQVVIRPMMYVALSYDHRLVDGAQAVSFLVRLKELLEDPARMALAV